MLGPGTCTSQVRSGGNMEAVGFNRSMLSTGKIAGEVREGFLEEGVWLTTGLSLLPGTAFLTAQIVYSVAVS